MSDLEAFAGHIWILTGLGQILRIGLRLACFIQLTLMVCFVVLLHRSFPGILIAAG